jgi:hypothetical protein
MKHVCSICKTPFEFDYKPDGKLPPDFPFCSLRCKRIDLGKWLNEEYRIKTYIPDGELMTREEKETLAQFLLDMGEIGEIIDDEE